MSGFMFGLLVGVAFGWGSFLAIACGVEIGRYRRLD